MALLEKFGNANLTHFKNAISFDGKGRTSNINISFIKDTAKNSISKINNVITLKIKMSIELIEGHVHDVDKNRRINQKA